MSTPPLALYVHLPWCVRKCPYCDFNSHPAPAAGVPEDAYLRVLLDDLEYAAAGCEGRSLVSVFFGGGTPSLFSPASIERILGRATALLPVASDLEVSLEANPGTIERGAFAAYRSAGVNRVSLGAQSFNDRSLASLGRIHAAEETRAAVAELRAAGLDSFNLDLMYALPEQTIDGALADLEHALALEPAHLSHYQLTVEPNTVFHRRPPPLPGEDAAFEMQETCQARLAAAGYVQYEVSAYARPGAACVHNLNYWQFGDYLGIGAGAHGKLTHGGRVTRTARHRSPARYMAATSRGAACGRSPGSCARGPAVRVLPQRAAARGWVRCGPVRGKDGACGSDDPVDLRVGAMPRAARLAWHGLGADRARPPLSQRLAGPFSDRAAREPGDRSSLEFRRSGCACCLNLLRPCRKSVMGPKQLCTPGLANPKYATLRAVIQVTH